MGRHLLVPLLLCAACSDLERYEGEPAAPPRPAAAPSAPEPAQPASEGAAAEPVAADAVFVPVAEFEALRDAGAVVLDARGSRDYAAGHVPGAVSALWVMFVDGDRSGLLSADTDRLQRAVRRLGVRDDSTVLVYGAWDRTWGEEGRIYWMLQYFGAERVHILEGGLQAWLGAGHMPTTAVPAPAEGDFVIEPRAELRATAADIERELESDDVVILDIRQRTEYEGATPYGSPRGGHIPRAVHFHWRDVFEPGGKLRSRDELQRVLSAAGIGDDTLVIAYCTGGIRSGFMYAVMRWAGHGRARNYDGSWWEWSGLEHLPVEP